MVRVPLPTPVGLRCPLAATTSVYSFMYVSPGLASQPKAPVRLTRGPSPDLCDTVPLLLQLLLLASTCRLGPLPPRPQSRWSDGESTVILLLRAEALFLKYNFLPNDDPVEIRPSPDVTQARHGCGCKISPPYVAPFPSLPRTDAKATLNYLLDKKN